MNKKQLEQLRMVLDEVSLRLKELTEGGPGSGFFGHKGRPGERGGSLPSDEAGAASDTGDEIKANDPWERENLKVLGRVKKLGIKGYDDSTNALKIAKGLVNSDDIQSAVDTFLFADVAVLYDPHERKNKYFPMIRVGFHESPQATARLKSRMRELGFMVTTAPGREGVIFHWPK